MDSAVVLLDFELHRNGLDLLGVIVKDGFVVQGQDHTVYQSDVPGVLFLHVLVEKGLAVLEERKDVLPA